MELKRLKTASLADALKAMAVGETCLAPEGYDKKGVAKTCCELKREGYIYITSCKTGELGEQVITRLK